MHRKTKSGARFHQSLNSPPPLLAEPEVLTHKQLPGPQPVSQDLNHELLGRLRSELPSKRQADHDIHARLDRKSTRLNSSHLVISYAVFCLKKKKKQRMTTQQYTIATKHKDTCTR